MTTALVDAAPEVTVAEIEQIEMASFVRMLVSDSQLRELFATDPAGAIERSGVSLCASTVEAIRAQSAAITGVTGDIDQMIAVVFFIVIIIR